jgi:hypothetical protein
VKIEFGRRVADNSIGSSGFIEWFAGIPGGNSGK